MKDRFKFRVYDKQYNTMLYPIGDEEGVKINGNGELVGVDKVGLWNGSGNCTLMQCTGLRDKNGKLIYEGDVVKIKNEIFFIKYEIGSFFIIRNQKILDVWYKMFVEAWNDDVFPLSQLYVDEYIQEEHIDCLEIIGNIYENADLLRGK